MKKTSGGSRPPRRDERFGNENVSPGYTSFSREDTPTTNVPQVGTDSSRGDINVSLNTNFSLSRQSMPTNVPQFGVPSLPHTRIANKPQVGTDSSLPHEGGCTSVFLDTSSSLSRQGMSTNVPQFGVPSLRHERIAKMPRFSPDSSLYPEDQPSKLRRLGTDSSVLAAMDFGTNSNVSPRGLPFTGFDAVNFGTHSTVVHGGVPPHLSITDTNVRSSPTIPPGSDLSLASHLQQPTSNMMHNTPSFPHSQIKGQAQIKKEAQQTSLPVLRAVLREQYNNIRLSPTKTGELISKQADEVFYRDNGTKSDLVLSANDANEVNFIAQRYGKEQGNFIAAINNDEESIQALINTLRAKAAHGSVERITLLISYQNSKAVEETKSQVTRVATEQCQKKQCAPALCSLS